MKVRTFITGIGIITPVGSGYEETKNFIYNGNKEIQPLRLFQTGSKFILPTGEINRSFPDDGIPRTHSLALITANEALEGLHKDLDAIFVGTTTGGMFTTETLLQKNDNNPDHYKYHAAGSVAEYIARHFKCKGPVITISTACSSGTSAISIALEMLRTGKAKRVLAVGSDSLCRFTYFGFNSLQLIDPNGARPFDKSRQGMTVSEGSAALLLEASDVAPPKAYAEILGSGLSCDAYHPTAPHPEGEGALNAMNAALEDAALSSLDIDYINLHGTGTTDNDLSEAKAINRLFDNDQPLLSSVKGAMGHSLAAAGAIEAVISAICISENIVPANTGCIKPDPELNIRPVQKPMKHKVQNVVSNSFGFGGNNASLIIGSHKNKGNPIFRRDLEAFEIIGSECITGAGGTDLSMDKFAKGESCQGMLPISEISKNLQPRVVRRLKRLPRIALSLADSLQRKAAGSDSPASVFWGTGWGALSETYDFLTELFESKEKFCSPTDFIGSVHNAAAGQVAMQYQSKGPNITTTGGDYSFEQSLLTAALLTKKPDETILVMGADEYHAKLSRLFDESVSTTPIDSDGGGALWLKKTNTPGFLKIFPAFYENADNNPDIISSLIQRLGSPDTIHKKYGAIFVGIPGCYPKTGEKQIQKFLSQTAFNDPVIDYRKYIGEHASASATATVLAIKFLQEGKIPALLTGGREKELQDKGILVINTGAFVTAIEIFRS